MAKLIISLIASSGYLLVLASCFVFWMVESHRNIGHLDLRPEDFELMFDKSRRINLLKLVRFLQTASPFTPILISLSMIVLVSSNVLFRAIRWVAFAEIIMGTFALVALGFYLI